MTSKLEHALALAAQGFYVFPCVSNSGEPLNHWRHTSTTNPKTITDWFICPHTGFQQDVNIGIDCFKSGITVVDVDVKDGKGGRESFEQLEKRHGWGDTRISKTPSGGIHVMYRGGGYKNSVAKLAPGLDIRSDGGFIVAPGSTKTNGEYKIIRDVPLTPIPEWLKLRLDSIGKSTLLEERQTGKTIISDNEDDIAAAIDYLKGHEPAVQGHGGDIHTYTLFCELKARGVSITTALDLVEEYWNPNCSPPWGHDTLIEKANSAYKSAQSATGVKSPHAEFDIPMETPPAKAVVPANFSTGTYLADECSFPPRDWVFGKFALAKNVTLVIAPPGVGKSTLTLAIALSKITGKEIMGIDPLDRAPVAIFNNEDNTEEQMRRLVACAKHYGITNADLSYPDVTELGSMLFLNGRDNAPLRIAKRLADGRIVADQAAGLVAYLKEHRIRMVIIDPLSMTHPANENSNEEMLIVGSIYAQVAEKADCAVVLVHHTRKADQASSEGHSGNLESARGASSLGGVARIAYTLNVLSKQEAKRCGVEEKNKSKYLLFEQAKANMSAPGEHKIYFERFGEVIGMTAENLDGESVGCLRPVNLKENDMAESKRPAVDMLIKDIESMVEDEPMTIADIARELANNYPAQEGKNARSLGKAIGRLMSEGILTGLRGTLKLKERLEGKRIVHEVCLELFDDSGVI